MSDREEGWYWVRDSEMTNGVWSPEYVWANGLIKSLATTVNDVEMGPRIPTPDETWRSIETAPKDGTDVLVYEPGHPSIPDDEGFIDLAHHLNKNVWISASGGSEPTLWTPLPEKPK